MTVRALVAVCLAMASASSAGVSRAAVPVNLVVILADDLGAGELGCYGHPTRRTPNLDRLAADGVRFETCYATPICSPSRVLLLTGRYGFRTGWYNFTGRPGSPTHSDPRYDLGKVETTFAHVLKKHGYVTGLAGRWLEAGHEHEQIPHAGFDEHLVWAIWGDKLPPGVRHTGAWENERLAVTARYWHPCLIRDGQYVPTTPADFGPDRINDYCRAFVRRHRDRPFLLFYPMVLVHRPYHPVPDRDRPGEKRAGNLRSFVEHMDHLVGQLLKELDESGLRRNTLVVFAGDNGTDGGGKGTATERGARVPLIVSCPGIVKSGVVADDLADLSDLFPTLAEFGGAALPRDRPLDGHSLAPILTGKPGPRREWVFSYLLDKRVLRDRRWLLEGDGRFFDCGDSRAGTGYRDLTASRDPEVLAARLRFEKILQDLPAPTLPAEPTRE
jgi:arylsulfatase A